jgi:hypothetical protein
MWILDTRPGKCLPAAESFSPYSQSQNPLIHGHAGVATSATRWWKPFHEAASAFISCSATKAPGVAQSLLRPEVQVAGSPARRHRMHGTGKLALGPAESFQLLGTNTSCGEYQPRTRDPKGRRNPCSCRPKVLIGATPKGPRGPRGPPFPGPHCRDADKVIDSGNLQDFGLLIASK